MRAAAIKNRMDPDTALPEDILLMECDDKGTMKIGKELEDAEANMKYDLKMERLKNAGT